MHRRLGRVYPHRTMDYDDALRWLLTLPDFERTGEFAMAAGAAGLDYPRLIEQIVNLALERYRRRR